MCIVVPASMLPFGHIVLPNMSLGVAVTCICTDDLLSLLPAGMVNASSAVKLSPFGVTNFVFLMIEYSVVVSLYSVIVPFAGLCSSGLVAILLAIVCSYSKLPE